MDPRMTAYTIVIATRNRLRMLEASVPLMLRQSRLPAAIEIIDYSDDHSEVAEFGAKIGATTDIRVSVTKSDQGNLARQRNIGLNRVSTPIVAFPDDDSFWYPDTAEKMMLVYESDPYELIGGVSSTPVGAAPRMNGNKPETARRIFDRSIVSGLRRQLESRLVPQPFDVFGAARIAELAPRARETGITAPFVETMGGFRMSFRTEMVRESLFDETLGHCIGYAQHEDKDVSLRLLAARKLLAAAPESRVFHAVAPGKRANGFAYGFCQILNYAYICAKIMQPGTPEWAAIPRYLTYKRLLYSLRRFDPYNREVARGASTALARLDEMLTTSKDKQDALYRALTSENLSRLGH